MNQGQKLEERRVKRGLTQQQVADALGVSRNTIYRWEANLSKPSEENLKRLNEILDGEITVTYTPEDIPILSAEASEITVILKGEKKPIDKKKAIKRTIPVLLLIFLALVGTVSLLSAIYLIGVAVMLGFVVGVNIGILLYVFFALIPLTLAGVTLTLFFLLLHKNKST